MDRRRPSPIPESSPRESTAQEFLQQYRSRSLLRFAAIGSVDDGKSTLIGRLLYDTNNIHTDQLETLAKDTKIDTAGEPFDFSLLTDGLKAEREQGITIDVAYRYFSTEKRSFIIADIPGHEQYTRNMATGASTANLAIILVDARLGVLTQTKRHAFIASLLGIPRLLLAVNKMDLVDYAERPFEEIREQFADFATRLGISDLRFIPISAMRGDNVVAPSARMPWFRGETVLEYLENAYIGSDRNLIDFRFPVQTILRGPDGQRSIAGRVASGRLRPGEEVMVLPSMRRTHVQSIREGGKECDVAFASQSVAISLEDHVDIARGDMLVRPNNVPHIADHLEAMLVWMTDAPSETAKPYILRIGTRETRARIQDLAYRVDVNTLSRESAVSLGLNDIGRVTLRTSEPLIFDPYKSNRGTGSFILIDESTHDTVGAGMVIDRLPPHRLREQDRGASGANLHPQDGSVTPGEKEARAGHRAVTLWFTGLSGSGKSTIARAVERRLFDAGRTVTVLDGDNLRMGLSHDLGFSRYDRSENIRRIAQVARLFNESGALALAAMICPYESDRALARTVIGEDRYIEVFVCAPIEVCESRDPKGLYRKARAGEIENFTGVSDTYETPRNASLVLDTEKSSIEECVARVILHLEEQGILSLSG